MLKILLGILNLALINSRFLDFEAMGGKAETFNLDTAIANGALF